METVLVLMASRWLSSKTAKLLRFHLDGLKKIYQKPVKVRIVNVYDLKILFCDGCGVCKFGKACPKNELDDFLKIVILIRRSSCFVVASAVYFLGFPAKLKAFIDRCEQFYCKKAAQGYLRNHRLLKGHLVLTGGKLTRGSLSQAIGCCKQFFACLDVELEECLVAPKTDSSGLFFRVSCKTKGVY